MRRLSIAATLASAGLVFTALAACTTQKTSYAAALERAGPVANGRARIVLLRPDQRFDNYSLSAAHIRIDDRKAGKLDYGGFLLYDVDRGDRVLAASSRNHFYGVCELQVHMKADETVYLDVAPRPTNALAELVGAAVGTAAVGAPTVAGVEDILINESTVEAAAAGAAGGAAGSAIEAAGKPCGGPFRLKLIDATAALEHLDRLSESE